MGDAAPLSSVPQPGWWARQRLWWRLWLICTATVLAGGSARMVLTLMHERALAEQAAEQSIVMGRSMLPLLQELALSGDVAGA